MGLETGQHAHDGFAERKMEYKTSDLNMNPTMTAAEILKTFFFKFKTRT